ncbi:MAG TPA: hypothetical protein VGE98_08085 [Thermoanaerobaculia bacterium]
MTNGQPPTDLDVMLRPRSVYAQLEGEAGARGLAALRRPLFVALVTGCVVSLLTSARLTARLAVPGTLYWTFVPAAEILGLAVVRGRGSFARQVDLYFRGHLPWLLLLLAYAAAWSFWPTRVYTWGNPPWIAGAVVVLAWSLHIDYWFLRSVAGHGAGRAAGALAALRLVSWLVFLVVFVPGAGWQVAASWVGV